MQRARRAAATAGERVRRYDRYEYRAVVGARPDPDALRAALRERLAAAPTERLRPLGDGGFACHAEPALYLLLTGFALAAMGGLGHVLALRAVPRVAAHGHALAAVLDALALLSLGLLLTSLAGRVEVCADRGAVVRRRYVGPWLVRAARVDAGDLTAALVTGATGRRVLALVGPRNAERLVLARERWTDPPRMLRWLADASALVAGLAQAQAYARTA